MGVGIDLIEVSRIKAMIRRHGEKFLARVFTPAEREYCQRSVRCAEHLAARFAAKEAAMKALGTGLSHGINWTDVEVGHEGGGAPIIILHHEAAAVAHALGVKSLRLSLTHIATTAAAVVIAQSESQAQPDSGRAARATTGTPPAVPDIKNPSTGRNGGESGAKAKVRTEGPSKAPRAVPGSELGLVAKQGVKPVSPANNTQVRKKR